MRTVVTYKQNEKWIYDVVEKHSAKGNWVKDILAAYIKGHLVYIDDLNREQVKQPKEAKKSIDLSELGDFAPK